MWATEFDHIDFIETDDPSKRYNGNTTSQK